LAGVVVTVFGFGVLGWAATGLAVLLLALLLVVRRQRDE
jgi:hypothetical protein